MTEQRSQRDGVNADPNSMQPIQSRGNTLTSTRHPIIEEDLRKVVASPLPWARLFGKKVLITGANGLIPSYLVETLLVLNDTAQADIEVIALVRSREKVPRRLDHLYGRSDLTIVVQDVRDDYNGPKAINFIVHAAGQASPKVYSTDPVGTFEVNVLGTWRMLQLARDSRTEGFLFLSSGEVYGHIPDSSIAVQETDFGRLDPLLIRSCYAEGKRAGETLCSCWHSQYGIPANIVRLGHTYGPRMDLNDGRVFADFVADIASGRNIIMKSDGSARRPFCYLADAVQGIFTVLLRGADGQAYNVGTEQEISISELADMLCQMFPERNCRVIRQERSPQDTYIPSANLGGHFDISKIKALGWEPTTGVEAGFWRTVKSYE